MVTATATVETGARLHFGFSNLSLAHDRLYGGIGVGLERPQVRITAGRAEEVELYGAVERDDGAVRKYVEDVVDILGVPGASVEVGERFERHVGLGSGTQFALACLVAVAAVYDRDVSPRKLAPALGRGGRSGVGVATFERGGFVVDAGHRTERFTSRLPERGSWTVPEPVVRRPLADSWRFVLVTPAGPRGRNGPDEDEGMQSVVERADPGIADEIATVLVRELLPAVAERNLRAFGRAVERVGRLNGAWYADEQGGVYRPPVGELVGRLRDSPAIFGAGQSSWGPTAYGVTDASNADRAREAAEDAAGTDGTVRVVAPATTGHSLE